MKIWAIYREQDLDRNERFINYLNEACLDLNMDFEVKIFEEFVLGIKNNKLVILYNNQEISDFPDGVINRTNDYLISKQLEMLGVTCFNNSTLTQIANDKNLCYQYVSQVDIKIQDTFFSVDSINNFNYSFPLVLKNPTGRGGNEVFLINDEDELTEKLLEYPNATLQEYCSTNKPRDLRVYVIGNKIVQGILRIGEYDFRANYSLSHNAQVYYFSALELEYIQKVINLFKIDYAGIDFLINDNGELIFNEIEDAVGARALYELTDINIAELYIRHIYKSIKQDMEDKLC